MTLPPSVRAECQRILDAEARRMLDEHMSGKADHSHLFADKGEAARLFGVKGGAPSDSAGFY